MIARPSSNRLTRLAVGLGRNYPGTWLKHLSPERAIHNGERNGWFPRSQALSGKRLSGIIAQYYMG